MCENTKLLRLTIELTQFLFNESLPGSQQLSIWQQVKAWTTVSTPMGFPSEWMHDGPEFLKQASAWSRPQVGVLSVEWFC